MTSEPGLVLSRMILVASSTTFSCEAFHSRISWLILSKSSGPIPGPSMMASALAAFFAPPERRRRLEASRLLAKPEEFFGYYSHLAGERFVAYEQLLDLLPLAADDDAPTPMVVLEEANLPPIEGYFSPLVHKLSGLQAAELPIAPHAQGDDVPSQVSEQSVPAVLSTADRAQGRRGARTPAGPRSGEPRG